VLLAFVLARSYSSSVLRQTGGNGVVTQVIGAVVDVRVCALCLYAPEKDVLLID
jgi:hypothetical protein